MSWSTVLVVFSTAEHNDAVDVQIRLFGVTTSPFRPHADGLLSLIFFRLSSEIGYLLLDRDKQTTGKGHWLHTFVNGVPTIKYPSLPSGTVSVGQGHPTCRESPGRNTAAPLLKGQGSIVFDAERFVGIARIQPASTLVRAANSSLWVSCG